MSEVESSRSFAEWQAQAQHMRQMAQNSRMSRLARLNRLTREAGLGRFAEIVGFYEDQS